MRKCVERLLSKLKDESGKILSMGQPVQEQYRGPEKAIPLTGRMTKPTEPWVAYIFGETQSILSKQTDSLSSQGQPGTPSTPNAILTSGSVVPSSSAKSQVAATYGLTTPLGAYPQTSGIYGIGNLATSGASTSVLSDMSKIKT